MAYREIQFLAVVLAAFTPLSYARVPKKIIDGERASIHDFPYQALLLMRERSGETKKSQLCGGTIISTTNILTAAHCFYYNGSLMPASLWTVITGTDDWLHQRSDEVFRVLSVIPHPLYNTAGENENDIGIMKLKRQISFDDRHNSVALPSRNIAGGMEATFTAWGRPTLNDPYPKPYLQKLETTVISLTECRAWVPRWKVHYNQVCIWSKSRGSPCLGDSGGALVSNGVLIGIHNKGLCNGDYPAVLADVYYYRSWIINNI